MFVQYVSGPNGLATCHVNLIGNRGPSPPATNVFDRFCGKNRINALIMLDYVTFATQTVLDL
jgi:hypothetical protein